MKPRKSHDNGLFKLNQFKSIGKVIFERGALVFHPNNIESVQILTSYHKESPIENPLKQKIIEINK